MKNIARKALKSLPPVIRTPVYRFFISPLTKNLARFLQSCKYFVGTWRSYDFPSVGLIRLANESGGLLMPLVLPWIGQREKVEAILISEPSQAATELMEWLTINNFLDKTDLHLSTLESELAVDWSPQQHTYDLTSRDAVPVNLHQRFDLIVCQSLLEHVLDPVAVIENLLKLRSGPRSILAIQTCNSFMGLHRYPIDTLRFFPDFFLEFGSKNGLEVKVLESGSSIYAFYAQEFTDQEVDRLEELFV